MRLGIPPSAWIEAESFIALIHHGRLTVDQARRDIGVDSRRRALLDEWIRTMPPSCRLTLYRGLDTIRPFGNGDLTFRDAVGAAFELLLADRVAPEVLEEIGL